MKRLFYIFLTFGLFGTRFLLAQAPFRLEPQVINSAGGFKTAGTNSLSLSDNFGEPFTLTFGYNTSYSMALTQGYSQPEKIAGYTSSVTAVVTDVTCGNKNDGKISTALTTTALKYKVSYLWSPQSVCPNNDCSSIDSLKAGTYSLNVVVNYTLYSGATAQDTVKVIPSRTLTVLDVNGPCKVKVFTGITINNDGLNDHLFIENISEFPNNTITIFNRWGAQLYHEKGYDNINKFWPTADEAGKLVPSTYFYVLDPGDGSKPVKGWIEIIKN